MFSVDVSPSTDRRAASTLKEAAVVSEKPPSGPSTKPSPPASKRLSLVKSSFTKALVSSIFSKSEYFEISFKFASPAKAEVGANNPNVAGAISKLLNSFIKSSHNL